MSHFRSTARVNLFSTGNTKPLVLGALVGGALFGCGQATESGPAPDAISSATSTSSAPTSSATSSTTPTSSAPITTSSAASTGTSSQGSTSSGASGSSSSGVSTSGGSGASSSASSSSDSSETGSDSDTSTSGGGSGEQSTSGQSDNASTSSAASSSDTGSSSTAGGGGAVVCPELELPAAASLAYMNEKMPNPFEFKFMDLPNVTTKELWECRRQEISAMAQEYLYGHLPKDVGEVTGSVSGGTISVSVKGSSGTANFSVNASGSGDILVIDFGIGAPKPANSRSASMSGATMLTQMRTAYGSTDVGIAMAAAWGVGRVIDVLELHPDAGIDPKKVVTTGCSTNGKLAAISAVFEPRVALGVPVESGACGAASWRVSSAYGGSDTNNDCQDIQHLETNWLGSVADPFVDGLDINKLPFDQGEVLAVRAPAPMMVFNNEKGWAWLCAKGNVATAQGAHYIYSALGVPDNFGFAESSASHDHCTFPNEHNAEVNAFYAKFLNGDESANTAIMRWNAASDEKATWFDWLDTPVTLE